MDADRKNAVHQACDLADLVKAVGFAMDGFVQRAQDAQITDSDLDGMHLLMGMLSDRAQDLVGSVSAMDDQTDKAEEGLAALSVMAANLKGRWDEC
jgi:hypothetical protein